MGTEEILAMPHSDQVSYWLGCFLVAIGRGELRNEIFNMITFYQREAYERGHKAGKGNK